MKKILCMALSLSLLFCSCGETVSGPLGFSDDDTTEQFSPNTDIFGVAFASSQSADPYTTENKINSELMGLICEPLFAVSENFDVTPVLCSDFSYSEREYTLNIKKGVTFSDGSALTPADVEYSLRAACEPASFYASQLSVIESISASDKGGYVKIKLKYDNARFPALLDIPIIKKGTRSELLPTGTGMYAPKDDLSALVLRRDHHSGKTAKYSVISLYDVTSSDELVFEFDSHNVSILTSDPTGSEHITPLSAAARTNVPTTQFHYLGFNTRKSGLSDKLVRRAIACAVDRENAAEGDFALMGNAATLPIHPKSRAYSQDFADELSYDGKTPLPISEPLTILVNSENSGKLAACNRIADALTRLGAPTTVRALPFEEYKRALQSGDFTLYYAEVSLGADFDITQIIGGSLNFGGFYDASLSSGLAAYLAGDEGTDAYLSAFCDTVPFVPILFKDTAMYSQQNFFKTTSPSSQNVYHRFCDWVIGG